MFIVRRPPERPSILSVRVILRGDLLERNSRHLILGPSTYTGQLRQPGALMYGVMRFRGKYITIASFSWGQPPPQPGHCWTPVTCSGKYAVDNICLRYEMDASETNFLKGPLNQCRLVLFHAFLHYRKVPFRTGRMLATYEIVCSIGRILVTSQSLEDDP